MEKEWQHQKKKTSVLERASEKKDKSGNSVRTKELRRTQWQSLLKAIAKGLSPLPEHYPNELSRLEMDRSLDPNRTDDRSYRTLDFLSNLMLVLCYPDG